MTTPQESAGLAGSPATTFGERLLQRHANALNRSHLERMGLSSSNEDESAETFLGSLIHRGGEGAAPDSAVQARLRPHLPFDLGVARLHHGPVAARAAHTLEADAFTIGRDVFFGENKFDPASRGGMGLVAHEMTHVGQQVARFDPSGGGKTVRRRAASSVLDRIGSATGAPASGENVESTSPSLLRRDPEPIRPEMVFVMPPGAPSTGEAGPPPSQRATERGMNALAASGLTDRPAPAPRQADPFAVAERVYDLMKQEVRVGRERGLGRR